MYSGCLSHTDAVPTTDAPAIFCLRDLMDMRHATTAESSIQALTDSDNPPAAQSPRPALTGFIPGNSTILKIASAAQLRVYAPERCGLSDTSGAPSSTSRSSPDARLGGQLTKAYPLVSLHILLLIRQAAMFSRQSMNGYAASLVSSERTDRLPRRAKLKGQAVLDYLFECSSAAHGSSRIVILQAGVLAAVRKCLQVHESFIAEFQPGLDCLQQDLKEDRQCFATVSYAPQSHLIWHARQSPQLVSENLHRCKSVGPSASPGGPRLEHPSRLQMTRYNSSAR